MDTFSFYKSINDWISLIVPWFIKITKNFGQDKKIKRTKDWGKGGVFFFLIQWLVNYKEQKTI
jgi:hypothetical protein